MSDQAPIPLAPVLIPIGSPDYSSILAWEFADSYVSRVLGEDIPRRALFGYCRFWGYREPNGQIVGFGTLDLCRDYEWLTGGRIHPYIPLLAVRPKIKSLGYGTSIVAHLSDESAILADQLRASSDTLFLDVYSTNSKAIDLYHRSGFTEIHLPEPLLDEAESQQPYIVMVKSVRIERG